MSTDKSAAAIRELVERWMGKKHPITMQSYVSDLTALISEHYVAKEEVDKMVEERSEFIKKAVIRFFYTEVDLNFCTREYRDRVEWYFNTYQHEIFKLPKTSLDNFKSREK
jgi:hypothetical protein